MIEHAARLRYDRRTMPHRIRVVAGLMLAAAGASPAWMPAVRAQVSFDPRALQNLQHPASPAPAATPAPPPAPAATPPPTRATTAPAPRPQARP
ncbi:MAG: hypothetical protein JO326_08910, partial [Acetobacteraceae bacterium]|nr:hypothetical protein [Acetobacteraceae bacterium]